MKLETRGKIQEGEAPPAPILALYLWSHCLFVGLRAHVGYMKL